MKLNKREALVGAVKTREGVRAEVVENEELLDFVIVSKNNEGIRYSWDMGGFYIERLSIEGANLDKLNTFFKDHKRGVDDAIGHVSRKSVDEVVRASVLFDEDGSSVKRKYLNKTLTDVSIGYSINKYEVEERETEPDIVTVTDYDIIELSAVGVGFDPEAKHDQIGRSADVSAEDISERLSELEKKFKKDTK